MPKFRKRPVAIEAEQVRLGGALPDGVEDNWDNNPMLAGTSSLTIDTMEGRMRVKNGDWIVTGIKGERYAVDNDIFQATYELVEEP